VQFAGLRLEYSPMSMNDPSSLDAELEALRKRSAELIAEVCRISRRIDALAAKAKPAPAEPADPAMTDPAITDTITDTWVDLNGPQGSGPNSAP
jgi:hypothetical protein